MDDKRLVRISKYLARHLRHDPGRLGLHIEPGGWVQVASLLAACKAHSFPLSARELREVVERNDKRRFSFDASGSRIRANQGHSIDIDLQLTKAKPPPKLFHGTARGSVESILESGLERRGRHHVHLSQDEDAALKVGQRHGPPIVLEVASGAMVEEGHVFFRSDNGVWLTEAVPPCYLTARWDAS